MVCSYCQRSSRHAPLFGIQWPHLAVSGLNDLSSGALGHWLDFYLPTLQALPVLGVAVGQGIIFPLAWKHADLDEQSLVSVRRTATQERLKQIMGALSLRILPGKIWDPQVEQLVRQCLRRQQQRTISVSWSKALSKESLDSWTREFGEYVSLGA